jgi:XTP/dITP diphosphohydrolase
MSLPPQLAIATKNEHKVRELLEICAGWPVRWRVWRGAGALAEPGADAGADWPDVEETGDTYEENALLKAGTVARVVGVPAIADDSGIEVDALGGAPGARSARFAGEHASDEANLELLIDRMRDVPEAERTGRYVCVAACALPDGDATWVRATCEGRLIPEPRGSGGFGYDPIFVPSGESRTMAELAPAEKHAISHRGKAFRGLREALEALHETEPTA